MNLLFRKRIGIPEDKNITFEYLDTVLGRMARTIPFENLAVIEGRTKKINRKNLVEKILINKEGGLCYDTNLLLYYFITENGFDALLTEARTYDRTNKKFREFGGEHLVVLLIYQGEMYLLDSGFGSNLALKPVPFNGETVTSRNGDFRVRKKRTEHGYYIFEMKVKQRDNDWQVGYAINPNNLIEGTDKLNKTQDYTVNDKRSSFNKDPLATRLTGDGRITLTKNSFTKISHGVETKEEISRKEFEILLKKHFGLKIKKKL